MGILTLLEGFLLIILFGILFLIALRYLAPYFLRFVLRRLSKKMEREFGDSYTIFKKPQKRKPFTPDKVEPKKSNKSFGEYIDFEEID